ncbi:Cell differentiation, Rcd1-like protein [Thalictrum thalictroides]|uniref:Cell differentiation, Rcd1-like protein n=1 Tax=Thalictrum thalictroides TaxID=46969 RepID=A0A7J6XD99_THATH|nr:Cell differentiation, Rcd1-like protein [Thalictrum thalictroides]
MFQGVRRFQAVDRVRAYALSVVGILCQAGEPQIIQKVIEGDMIETCRVSIEVGSELCKVIGIHILETILQDQMGLSGICSDNRLSELMKTLEHMVAVLARNQDASPRLLFHIIRCYILLCGDMRGLSIVKKNLPQHFTNDFFRKTTEEHPNIRELLDQLLLTVGAH